MSNRYVSNPGALREIAMSSAVGELVDQVGQSAASRAGDGFVASTRVGANRQRSIVYADTWSAKHREVRENILVRVLG